MITLLCCGCKITVFLGENAENKMLCSMLLRGFVLKKENVFFPH